jgi:hypothetical protein
MQSLKDKFLHSIIMEFLEYCIESADCDMCCEEFHGKEHEIIDDFLKKRNEENEC